MAEAWSSHGHREQLAAMLERTGGVEDQQGAKSADNLGAGEKPLLDTGHAEIKTQTNEHQ
jgi:hypothetical protein